MSLPIKYSYSGADCRAVAKFGPNGKSVTLDSLATISYSIYEAKSPVRALGHRTVKGYTESIRTVAGSMVFLVIEDHPLAKLVNSAGNRTPVWSKDLKEKGHSYRKKDGESKRFISTLLQPFNIDLFYKTEVAFTSRGLDKRRAGYKRNFHDGAHLQIKNINIVSEGMVTSVNDMVTEITMQFVAEDVFNIETTNAFNLELNKKANQQEPIIKVSVSPEAEEPSAAGIHASTESEPSESPGISWETATRDPNFSQYIFGGEYDVRGKNKTARGRPYSYVHRYSRSDADAISWEYVYYNETGNAVMLSESFVSDN